MRTVCIMMVLALGLTAPATGQSVALPSTDYADLDRDGIDDAMEQALLEKFLPHFHIASGECDVAPSLFLEESPEPVAVRQDGTIYGQAFGRQATVAGQNVKVVELHFYHLWRNDCGKRSHALDAEHVSVLVTAESMAAPVAEWKALYWYASAHQGTPCDKSHAASAQDLQATDTGASVAISAGKHASYLDTSLCRQGCGADRCEISAELKVPKVVNLGEPGAPLNGAQWTASNRWMLQQKMSTDFPDALLAALQSSNTTGIAAAHKPTAGVQTTIMTASVTAGALATAGEDTGHALDTANSHTNDALGHSAKSVQNALQKAAVSTGRFLGAIK